MGNSVTILFMGILLGWLGIIVFEGQTPQPLLVEKETVESYAEIPSTERRITWVSSRSEVEQAFQDYYEETGKKVRGLAVWTEEECTIYAYEPKNEDDSSRMNTLGHEMLHCFIGSYHD